MSDPKISAVESGGKLKKEMGLFTVTAIGVSQMIGTGIYMAPQGLAECSNPMASLIACIIVGIGTLLIALSFGNIGEKFPVSGSAIVYTNAAFGETPAFMVGWTYWWSNILGIPAIVTGTLAYGSYFIPGLADNNWMIFIFGSAIVWFYTYVNIRGIGGAGKLNLILTVIKLIPLVVFFVIAIMHFDSSNMETVSSAENEGMGLVPMAVGYLVWSFLGFEGTTISAGEVKNSKNVKRATILCAITVMFIYICFIILATGSMNQGDLATSTSPVADIIAMSTGSGWAGAFIAIGVFISGFACAGAWTISSARITYSLGEQGLVPDIVTKTNPKYKTPATALIIDAVVCTAILAMNFSKGLVEAYNFLIVLSSLASLIFYAFGVASEIMLLRRGDDRFSFLYFIKSSFISLVALAYIIYACYSCGADYVMYGFLFILVGMPFYIYVKYKKGDALEIQKKAGIDNSGK